MRWRLGLPEDHSLAALPLIGAAIASAMMALSGCGRGHHEPDRVPLLPIAAAEAAYGPLVAAGNRPTPHQNGTGERVGLFLDAGGTVWGLPLSAASDGAVLACAPPGLHDAAVTDTFPAGAAIVGSTNEPTGWRGGTGDLEILLRSADGAVRWQVVHGAQIGRGPACRAPESPGTSRQLQYYRLTPTAAAVQ